MQGMKTWKRIKIYKVQASTKWDAMELFRKAEEDNSEKANLTDDFVTDDKPKPRGWLAQLKQQVVG